MTITQVISDFELSSYYFNANEGLELLIKNTGVLFDWVGQRNTCKYVLPWYREVTKEFVDSAHNLGLKVMPYPWPETRSEESKETKRAFANGVDAVICNIPSDAEELARQYKRIKSILTEL